MDLALSLVLELAEAYPEVKAVVVERNFRFMVAESQG